MLRRWTFQFLDAAGDVPAALLTDNRVERLLLAIKAAVTGDGPSCVLLHAAMLPRCALLQVGRPSLLPCVWQRLGHVFQSMCSRASSKLWPAAVFSMQLQAGGSEPETLVLATGTLGVAQQNQPLWTAILSGGGVSALLQLPAVADAQQPGEVRHNRFSG